MFYVLSNKCLGEFFFRGAPSELEFEDVSRKGIGLCGIVQSDRMAELQSTRVQ